MKVEIGGEYPPATPLFFFFLLLPLLYLVEIEMMQGFVWGNHANFSPYINIVAFN